MKTAIVGASGYAGTELLRLLLEHPKFEVSVITAHSNAGELISSVAPQLVKLGDRRFEKFDLAKVNACEIVFLALPHGESAALISSPVSVRSGARNERVNANEILPSPILS